MTKKAITQAVSSAFRSTQAKLAAGTALVLGSAAAHAQEANGAAQAFSQVQSEVGEMAGHAWPVATAITASLIGIKLFKKFANRAS
ncbi:major coat protein [Vreelandella sp. EE22]